MILKLTTEELFKLTSDMSERDIKLTQLEREVQRLTEENQQLRARQSAAATAAAEREKSSKGFVVLPVDRLCRLLSGLNVHLSSFLCIALQKMLPTSTPPEAIKQMVEAAKMEEKPVIHLSPQGDMKVDKLVNHGTVVSSEQIDVLHVD